LCGQILNNEEAFVRSTLDIKRDVDARNRRAAEMESEMFRRELLHNLEKARKKRRRPSKSDRVLVLMQRWDRENESVIRCRCGDSYSWEGIDDGLRPFLRRHIPCYREDLG
jgi:hypothetical protein